MLKQIKTFVSPRPCNLFLSIASRSTVGIWRKISLRRMAEYNDVVAGKLRLKGKGALDVKLGGTKKKKKKHKKHYEKLFNGSNFPTDLTKEDLNVNVHGGKEEMGGNGDDRLTPAEKRYLERWQQLEMQRMAKTAAKSHRDRIHEFNQCLANLTEHYDIPKVGPG